MGCPFSKSQDPMLTSFRQQKSFIAESFSNGGKSSKHTKNGYHGSHHYGTHSESLIRVVSCTPIPTPQQSPATQASTISQPSPTSKRSSVTSSKVSSAKENRLPSSVYLTDDIHPSSSLPVEHSETVNTNYSNKDVSEHGLRKTRKSRCHDLSIDELNNEDTHLSNRTRSETILFRISVIVNVDMYGGTGNMRMFLFISCARQINLLSRAHEILKSCARHN